MALDFTPDWDDMFWRHVCPEALSGCWLWMGMTKGSKKEPLWYGRIERDGKSYKAHRVAYAAAFGVVLTPDEKVRHKCDVPACVNPYHLVLGTIVDNNADRHARGRNAHGRALSASHRKQRVLTEDAVLQIREALRRGVPQQEIALVHGVKRAAISKIATGQRWGWLI